MELLPGAIWTLRCINGEPPSSSLSPATEQAELRPVCGDGEGASERGRRRQIGGDSPVAFAVGAEGGQRAPAVLTVWRKSLLLNGNGFAVFDAMGNLVFRVDNYASGSKAEVVLMDAAGKPLLTVRRKKLSLGDHWMIFDGEEVDKPRFTVKRQVNPLQSRALAQVTPCGASGAKPCNSYKIEGSYSQRCCAMIDDKRQQLVEIKRKEPARGIAFDLDVFRLIVQPDFDASFAMAIVMLLEQMFRPRASLLKYL